MHPATRPSLAKLLAALLLLALALPALASYNQAALQQAYSEVQDWVHFSPRWDIRCVRPTPRLPLSAPLLEHSPSPSEMHSAHTTPHG